MRGATEGINLVAQSWGRRNVGEATRSSSRSSSTTPTSCPGSSSPPRRAPSCASRRSTTAARSSSRSTRSCSARGRGSSSFTPGLERARHDHAGAEMIEMAHRHGATRARRRRAGGLAHAASTCRRSTATSTCSPGTRCSRPTGIGAVFGKRERARGHAAVAGRRQHDRRRHLREDACTRRRPCRFEAGTGNIADAVGLGAALDYLMRHRPEQHRALRARAAGLRDARACSTVPGLRLIGTAHEKAGVLSFVLDECRTEDVGGARPGGHRRALGPPLRAADPAPLRPREHGARLARALQYAEDIDALVQALLRIQSGRAAIANSDNISVTGGRASQDSHLPSRSVSRLASHVRCDNRACRLGHRAGRIIRRGIAAEWRST